MKRTVDLVLNEPPNWKLDFFWFLVILLVSEYIKFDILGLLSLIRLKFIEKTV